MIIIEAIMMTIFVCLCLFIISEGINKQLKKERDRQKNLNKQLCNLLQIEENKTALLYTAIAQIKEALLKSENYTEEEFKNTLLNIVDWIEKLQKISKGE